MRYRYGCLNCDFVPITHAKAKGHRNGTDHVVWMQARKGLTRTV